MQIFGVSRSLLLTLAFALAFATASSAIAHSQDAKVVAAEFSSRYQNILVDARGSRGGNGDIAAAYLTLTDWIKNYDVTSKITVLVDENGRERFLNLAQGNLGLLARVNIVEAKQIVESKPFSLYLVFANPSGTYRYQGDIGTLFKLTPNATLIVQTVLGNTENENSLQPFATVEHAGRVYDWGPAGLGKEESGVYTDIVAERLRSLSFDEVKAQTIGGLNKVTDEFSRRALTQVLNGASLKDSKIGLVYGISAEQTKKQFMSYLRGLSQAEEAHVLFTPSAFRADDVTDPLLKDRLSFLTSVEQIPKHALPGHVYVIETKTLPHETFVSLMALSMKNGVVPVGAGDGFLSAAIELGGAFVLTQVPWNRANARRIRELLFSLAIKHGVGSADLTLLRSLLGQSYEAVDFARAGTLARFAPLFRLLKAQMPKLSERVMEVAIAAPEMSEGRLLHQVDDRVLRKSAFNGGRESSVTHRAQTCSALF